MTSPSGRGPDRARPGAPGRDPRSGGAGIPPGARGAVLVGILVIAGIVGLQILDDSAATDVTVTGTDSTTSTSGAVTDTTGALRPPNEVRVIVYNASTVDQRAQVMTDTLKALGWATQEPSTLTPARTGTSVQCVAGFEGEAASLAADVGEDAVVEDYPSTPPEGAAEADCLVILGKT